MALMFYMVPHKNVSVNVFDCIFMMYEVLKEIEK